jgi:hypothetical protein
MDKPDEETQTPRVWTSLRKAGLVQIKLDEFPEKLQKVKHVAMGRLGELLERQTGVREQESVARSLGTLKRLETTLRADARAPRR